MSDIKYSVVATTYNDEKEIIEYLDSICEQTVLPTEIIIADGGSKDRTVELINDYKRISKIPIVVISGKRLNIAEGYNTAIKASTSMYIGITGIGNLYEANFFKLLIESLVRQELDYAYAPIRGLNSNKFSCEYNRTLLSGEKGMSMKIASNHGALVKKNIFYDLNFFYEKLIYAGEDTEFYSRVRETGYKGTCVCDAFLYWKTPGSFKAFLKQIENYTIGYMQESSNKRIFMRCRKIILFLFFCFLILGLLGVIGGVKGVLGLFLVYGACAIIYRLGRRKSITILMINRVFPLFYIIKNIRYMNENYKIKR